MFLNYYSFSPELEWDEAEWNLEPPASMGGHSAQNDRSLLSYATVPDDAAFTLYRHMQAWKHPSYTCIDQDY